MSDNQKIFQVAWILFEANDRTCREQYKIIDNANQELK